MGIKINLKNRNYKKKFLFLEIPDLNEHKKV